MSSPLLSGNCQDLTIDSPISDCGGTIDGAGLFDYLSFKIFGTSIEAQ